MIEVRAIASASLIIVSVVIFIIRTNFILVLLTLTRALILLLRKPAWNLIAPLTHLRFYKSSNSHVSGCKMNIKAFT